MDRPLTYDEARIMCAGVDSHLAVPRTETENQCAIAAAADRKLWLGVTEVVGDEGHYVGEDACGDVKGFWASTQPDVGGDEHRIVLTPSGNLPGWHDYSEKREMYPLCQLALSYRPQCE